MEALSFTALAVLLVPAIVHFRERASIVRHQHRCVFKVAHHLDVVLGHAVASHAVACYSRRFLMAESSGAEVSGGAAAFQLPAHFFFEFEEAYVSEFPNSGISITFAKSTNA